ncbi:hypothetical protein AB0F64_04405 [Streptomyces sp. NPDC026294]|uniref:hypothetical protein n=1 Tax=Streptomyces sp. NPDC026294 TaxID=3155362 RepID=UPI0033E34E65
MDTCPTTPELHPETVVMTWYGDGMIAATSDSHESAKTLHGNGFSYDPAERAFVLPHNGDTSQQARRVQAVGQQLEDHGIGVIMRHRPRNT